MASALKDDIVEELEIIDLDEESGYDEETWLVSSSKETDGEVSSWRNWRIEAGEGWTKKKSLVEKLDVISRSSPVKSSRLFSSPSSPASAAYYNLSSTPVAKSKFDPRTFTRPSPVRSGSVGHNKEILNLTFDRPNLNSTFTRPSNLSNNDDDGVSTASDSSASHRLNDVGDVQNVARLQEERLRQNTTFDKVALNATFDVGPGVGALNATYQKSPVSTTKVQDATFEVDKVVASAGNNSRQSRRSSRDTNELDDRLSSASADSSASHRLNDVGDVQQLARLQEESLRQAVMAGNHRSSTVSPSSDCHSPSTEGGGVQSEDAGVGFGKVQRASGQYQHQYSSQDSLPDSPYSSQSLESQPSQGQDRLRRSMPNLNKIRGQNKIQGNGGHVVASSAIMRPPTVTYGLSRQHNSDPRLQSQQQQQQQKAGRIYDKNNGANVIPSRGAVVSRDSSAGSTSGARCPPAGTSGLRYAPSGLRNPSKVLPAGSRIARPPVSGIPRAGSRLPGPATSGGRSAGLPKPVSNPGSRASSTGPRKTSNCY